MGRSALRRWRVQSVPPDLDHDGLAAVLRNHEDLQPHQPPGVSGTAPRRNGARVLTLSFDTNRRDGSQVATIHFERLPSRLASCHQLVLSIHVSAESNSEPNLIVDDHFEGLTVLGSSTKDAPSTQVLEFPEDLSVNILAVPGLAGHPVGSFIDKATGHLWLTDSLPEDLPNATVLTYGHDRKLLQGDSNADIRNFGENLYSAIGQLLDVSSHPLIIVAHSLGGLVVKHALHLMSECRNAHGSDILRLVTAVAFFGTPHQGINVQHLLPMLRQQPNDRLVASICRFTAQALATQQQDWTNVLRCTNLDVYSFCELKPSPTAVQHQAGGAHTLEGPEEFLVDEASASHCFRELETPPRAFGVHKTHADLIKFSSGHEPSYTKFLFDVDQTCRRLHKIQAETLHLIEEEPKGLESPGSSTSQPVTPSRGRSTFSDPKKRLLETFKEHLSDHTWFPQHNGPYKNTCDWISQTEQFQSWLEGQIGQDTNGCLWIRGGAGAGKTTLMRAAKSHLATGSRRQGSFSFSFRRSRTWHESSALPMWRALIRQMLDHLDVDNVCAVLRSVDIDIESADAQTWRVPILKKLFRAVIKFRHTEALLVFLDGLHNCHPHECQDTINFFEDHGSTTPRSEFHFKVCFAARPSHQIHISPQTTVVALESMPQHSQSIELYVNDHLKVTDPSISQELRACLCKKAAGNFLWAVLALRTLTRWATERAVSFALWTIEYSRLRKGLVANCRELPSMDDLSAYQDEPAARTTPHESWQYSSSATNQFHGALPSDKPHGLDFDQSQFCLAALERLPEGLDALLGFITGNLEADLDYDEELQREFLLCMQWVLFARQPLSILELSHAILVGTIDSEELPIYQVETLSDDNLKAMLIHISRGLVDFLKDQNSKDQKACLVHDCIRDFLLENDGFHFREIWRDLSLTSDPLGQSHQRLSSHCLKYLTICDSSPIVTSTLNAAEIAANRQLARNISKGATQVFPETGTPRDLDRDRESRAVAARFPLYPYAVRGSLYHADVAAERGLGQHSFFEHFPRRHWVRLRNLTTLSDFRIEPLSQPSLLYILAQSDTANLIEQYHPHNAAGFEEEDEAYRCPIGAALAANSANALGALLLAHIKSNPALLPPCDHLDYCDQWEDRSHSRKYYMSLRAPDTLTMLLKMGAHRAALYLPGLFTPAGTLNASDENARTLLSRAASAGDAHTVRVLLEYGANTTSTETCWSLDHVVGSNHRVSESDRISVLKAFLDNGADMDTSCLHGNHKLLTLAAESSDVGMIRFLTRRHANLEVRGPNGQTALSVAAESPECSHQVLEVILECGADVNSRDDAGRTPLSLTAGTGAKEALERIALGKSLMLLRPGAQREKLCTLLQRGAQGEINAPDNAGRTALSWAATSGSQDSVIATLVDEGAHVNASDMDGRAPLSWAAGQGNAQNVQALVDRGAEIDARDATGRTPLSWAASFARHCDNVAADKRAAEELRQRQALSTPSEFYTGVSSICGPRPARGFATDDYKGSEIVKILLDAGADANSEDLSGITPYGHCTGGPGDYPYIIEALRRGGSTDAIKSGRVFAGPTQPSEKNQRDNPQTIQRRKERAKQRRAAQARLREMNNENDWQLPSSPWYSRIFPGGQATG